MYELNLSEMTDKEFTISSFSVTDKTIFPPEPYVCEKGMVLRDRFFYVVKGKIRFVTENGQELVMRSGDRTGHSLRYFVEHYDLEGLAVVLALAAIAGAAGLVLWTRKQRKKQ